MTRALLILLAGILLAVLATAVIAGDRDLLGVLGPVLVTTALGMAVMAVAAWRARIRQRAEQLGDEHLLDDDTHHTHDTHDTPSTPMSGNRATDEDTNRG